MDRLSSERVREALGQIREAGITAEVFADALGLPRKGTLSDWARPGRTARITYDPRRFDEALARVLRPKAVADETVYIAGLLVELDGQARVMLERIEGARAVLGFTKQRAPTPAAVGTRVRESLVAPARVAKAASARRRG